MKKAPLSKQALAVLRADAKDLYAAAKRKGTTLDAFEERRERAAAASHFDLGCWLHYYSKRIGLPEGLDDRIECAQRLFQAGFFNPGYDFFTVFDFGERQFDTIFEMGDAAQVIDGLRGRIAQDATGYIACAFSYFGWPMEKEMTFNEKKLIVQSKGVLVRQEDELEGREVRYWLWFCPGESWFGYFDTEQEAWQQAFQWFKLEPLTSEDLKDFKDLQEASATCA